MNTTAESATTAVESAGEQRVTWAELFFDLVWVFAITQVASVLAESHSLADVAKGLLLFLPLWMGWVGATLLGNASGASLDGAHGRLLLFALAGCGLGMSVAVPDAFESSGLIFGGCYVLMRLILWQRMRQWPLFGGLRVEPFAVSLLVAGPLFLIGGIVGGSWRVLLWTLAVIVEIMGTALLGNRLDQACFETAHLPERFGLFVILALGENVVAAGTKASSMAVSLTMVGSLALAFVLIVLLWWSYFHYGAPAARHSLHSDPVQARIVRDVFSYAHLAYAVAIILIAVGLKKMLAHPFDLPHSPPELMLPPGAALFLLGFCYARWRMFGAAAWPRFAGGLTCVILALLAPFLPILVTALAVVLVLVAINGVEAWIVETRRPLPLVKLPRWRKPEPQE